MRADGFSGRLIAALSYRDPWDRAPSPAHPARRRRFLHRFLTELSWPPSDDAETSNIEPAVMASQATGTQTSAAKRMADEAVDAGASVWHKNTFLGQLQSGAQATVLSLGHERRYETDEVLIAEGALTRDAFILLSGKIRVTTEDTKGRVVLLTILIRGDLVGEMSSLDNQPRSATVTAAQPTRVRVIPQPEFRQFLHAHPSAGLAISRIVQARLRWATRRRVDFRETVPRRLARVAYYLAEEYGIRTSSTTVSLELFTQPDLAALAEAGAVPAHRALKELREDGLIEVGYSGVTIPSMDRLREFAGLETEPPP